MAVEGSKRLGVSRGSDVGQSNPDDRRHGYVDEIRQEGVLLEELGFPEDESRGDDEGERHGRDLAPGVDAPPEPSQNEDQAGAGAEADQDLEGEGRALKIKGKHAGQDHQYDGGYAADQDHFLFTCLRSGKAFPEVVGDIRGAPVQVSGNGRNVSGHQGSYDDALKAVRQHGQHSGVSQVVAGHGVREGRFQRIQRREEDQRGQRDEQPGPGTEGVVRDVEEERGARGVRFVLGRQDALSKISAAARFRAGIPGAPPLHQNGHEKQSDEKVQSLFVEADARGVDVEGGQDVHLRLDQRIVKHGVQAAGAVDGNDGRRDGADHGDDKEQAVGDQNALKAAQHGEDRRDGRSVDDGLPGLQSQHDAADLDGGHGNGGHDDDVEEETEIDGAEASQEGRAFAAVAEFIETKVGYHAGTAPELGVDESREHACHQEGPPAPVLGHAALPDHVGHEVRSVGREGRGDHGEAQEPPGHGTAGKEEVLR